MKLVTAMSAVALVLTPAFALAENPASGAGDTQNQPGLKGTVEHYMGKITGSSKESANAKKGEPDSAAVSSDYTNYPDRAAVKTTGK